MQAGKPGQAIGQDVPIPCRAVHHPHPSKDTLVWTMGITSVHQSLTSPQGLVKVAGNRSHPEAHRRLGGFLQSLGASQKKAKVFAGPFSNGAREMSDPRLIPGRC